jgi:hypothetical protein
MKWKARIGVFSLKIKLSMRTTPIGETLISSIIFGLFVINKSIHVADAR